MKCHYCSGQTWHEVTDLYLVTAVKAENTPLWAGRPERREGWLRKPVVLMEKSSSYCPEEEKRFFPSGLL